MAPHTYNIIYVQPRAAKDSSYFIFIELIYKGVTDNLVVNNIRIYCYFFNNIFSDMFCSLKVFFTISFVLGRP